MSRSKAKGTWAESKIRDYLTAWFHDVIRPATKGAKDEGDLANIPETVVEIKNCGRYNIPAWIRELDTEITNAGARYGVLVVKPNGVGETRIGEWWAVQPLSAWAAAHAELLEWRGHTTKEVS